MKKYKIIVLFIILITSLIGCSKKVEPPKKNVVQNNDIQLGKYGENLAVSRAVAAKMIALSFFTKDEINNMEVKINFQDVNMEDWYYPYINAVYSKGFMKGDDDGFKPLEPLSLSQAQLLIDKIYTSNKTRIKITEDTKDKPISLSLWCELYKKAVENEKGSLEDQGIKEETMGVFITPNNSNIDPWTMYTTKGEYKFSGFYMDGFIDATIKVLTKNNEILTVLSVEDNKIDLDDVYISDFKDNELKITIGKYERWLKYDESSIENKEKAFASVEISNNSLKSIDIIDQMVSGSILKISDSKIELKDVGTFNKHEGFKVYEERNGICKETEEKNLISGSDIGDFYIKDNIAYGVVIRRNAQIDKMRVVLSKTDFAGYVHDNVEIYSENGFVIKDGDETQNLNNLNINKDNYSFNNDRIFISPSNKNDKITVKSIKRNDGFTPEYRGELEIEKTDEGFIVINVIDPEEYLYSVVPSEMPTRYGVEAAKVQAITARSYAYNQFYANKFCEFGANVDDSVMCQVYNNIGESDVAIEAVNATKGLCLTYNNVVISANFFSTSSGYTANSGEVWADTAKNAFPSTTLEYLKSKKQHMGKDYGDLTKDENIREFIKDTNIKCYDDNSCWFRWSFSMSVDEISATINKNIKAAYNRNKNLVKTLDSDGIYKSLPVESIGKLQDIQVTKRGEGGNAMEIMLKGSEKQVLVQTEYNIRTILRPVQYIEGKDKIRLTCSDGTVFNDYSLLPSGFFVMERMTLDGGILTEVRFFGGGNGHGVGMSQNGVYGMVQEGYKYNDILTHYYPGTEINNVFRYEN